VQIWEHEETSSDDVMGRGLMRMGKKSCAWVAKSIVVEGGQDRKERLRADGCLWRAPGYKPEGHRFHSQ
jgi:hypothetical protein